MKSEGADGRREGGAEAFLGGVTSTLIGLGTSFGGITSALLLRGSTTRGLSEKDLLNAPGPSSPLLGLLEGLSVPCFPLGDVSTLSRGERRDME